MRGFGGINQLALPNQTRLERMRGQIPNVNVQSTLHLGEDWAKVRDQVELFRLS